MRNVTSAIVIVQIVFGTYCTFLDLLADENSIEVESQRFSAYVSADRGLVDSLILISKRK